MWNERYQTPDYLFGKAPAQFLPRVAHHIPANAKVLCVADGEGRNSAYLASLGHHVTAFDVAPAALEKARSLATEQGVEVDFNRSGVEEWDWSQSYDAVVAIFIQFSPPDQRAQVFRDMARAIKPGGHLLLHGYAPRQVGYGTGGPPNESHMYTENLLRAAFDGWLVLELADYDLDLAEGTLHSGTSALVDFVAQKPG
ncbi:MAG: cyclopropane-fatty-acyl-phospholipid synthase family protein [Paracoccaceae bacterium]